MVGEREAIMKTGRDSGILNDNEVSCTYSRRKTEKKTKFDTADDDIDNIEIHEMYEHQQLVDKFVQEVIEKAKTEYFRQTGAEKSKGGKRKKGKENGLFQGKTSKKADKIKEKKKHHYKYSEPVDEKEISEYEPLDGDNSVQWNPNFGKERKDSQRSSVYNRTMASLRNILGCCIGKT